MADCRSLLLHLLLQQEKPYSQPYNFPTRKSRGNYKAAIELSWDNGFFLSGLAGEVWTSTCMDHGPWSLDKTTTWGSRYEENCLCQPASCLPLISSPSFWHVCQHHYSFQVVLSSHLSIGAMSFRGTTDAGDVFLNKNNCICSLIRSFFYLHPYELQCKHVLVESGTFKFGISSSCELDHWHSVYSIRLESAMKLRCR